MDQTRSYHRITITLEPQVFAKLPKRDRSAFINQVLKTNFQQEGKEQMYQFFKQRLLRDKDMHEWIAQTVRES